MLKIGVEKHHFRNLKNPNSANNQYRIGITY